nr:DUF2163 domain-containing protein [Chthonobacter albigriseus]
MPTSFAAHAAGAATTIATAWILARTDGVTLGFTDHDRPLLVEGVPCEPASGFDRTSATAHAGFAVGEEEVMGALTSDRITDADLLAGLYDGAAVEVRALDWRNPAESVLLRAGTIGEVLLVDGAFRAEVRGPASVLEQATGRLFARTCDAELGDARCGVPLAGFTHAATVAETDGPGRLRVEGVEAVPAGRFTRGRIAIGGRTLMIAAHRADETGVWITLWKPLAAEPPAGTPATLTAGCDKLFQTCRDVYANAVNFRGFPHMPGNDFVLSFARNAGENDGGVTVP